MVWRYGGWVQLLLFWMLAVTRIGEGKVVFSVGNYASTYAPCGISGNYLKVGFQGGFTGNVSGSVFVFDDCYFAITNFTYPSSIRTLNPFGGLLGQPPTSTYAFLINPIELTGHSPADTIVVYSQWGFATWDNIQIIYAWDSDAMLSYGEVILRNTDYTSAVEKKVNQLRSLVLKESKRLNVLASPPPPYSASPPPVYASPQGVGDYAGFDNCFPAIKNKLNIYWTLNGTGGNEYEIEFGIEARVGLNSWIGFGFSGNQTQFQMKDSDVVIVGWIEGSDQGFAQDFFITANQACEPIAGGHVGTCPDSLLGGSSTLNNVELISSMRKGDVTYVKYKRSLKTLDSHWDIDLTAPPSLTSPRYVIYASGPLAPSSTNIAPVLLNHDVSQGYFYNGSQIVLEPVIKSFNCSPLLGTKVYPHPILPPYTSPPPPFPPPPPPSANSCERKIDFQGTSYSFQTCNYLNGGFVILWTLEDTTLTAAFTTSVNSSNSWVAVGISPTGDVVGSSALVSVRSQNDQVEIKQYSFDGLNSNQVVPGGDLKASKLQGGIVNASILVFFFTLELYPDQTSAAYLFWTKGQSVDNSLLSQDGIDSALTSVISFKSGLVSTGVKPSFHLWKVHGSLATVAWGILLPLGALVARHGRDRIPHWFHFHQAFQVIGFSLGQVGFVIAFTMSKKHASLFSAHKGVGILLFALTVIQVLAVVWKPGSKSKSKAMWKKYHVALASLILLLAIVQIFMGFKISKAKHAFMYAYIVWLVFLFALFLSLELYSLLSSRSDSERLPTSKDTEMMENEEHVKGKIEGDRADNHPRSKSPPSVQESPTETPNSLKHKDLKPESLEKAEEGDDTASRNSNSSQTKSRNPFSGPLSENMRKFNLLPRREPAIKVDKYNVKATITGTPDFLKKRHPPSSSSSSSSSKPVVDSSDSSKDSLSIGTIMENESTEAPK